MPRQYVIENGDVDNRWLYKVENGRGENVGTTLFYHPSIQDAMTFSKADAVAFAKRWRARAWAVKAGQPVSQVWPV